jgi:heat shock protein HslJ
MSDLRNPFRSDSARAMSWPRGLVALALALTACSVDGGGGKGGPIEGVHWVLERNDVSGAATAVPAEVVADARFGAGRVSGFGGCNSFNGAATVSGRSLAVGPLATTQMACSGAPTVVEAAYLANLGRAASFTATPESLTIFDTAGQPVLVYRVGAANPVAGNWSVTGVNNGREAVVSPQLGTAISVRFSSDGRVEGSGGCTPFSGSYTIAGQALRIGPIASTQAAACEPQVLEQERQFFTALGRVTTFDSSGATVMLRDDAGAMQVVISPDQATDRP